VISTHNPNPAATPAGYHDAGQSIMTSKRTVHVLNLAEGDLFRYRPGGEIYQLAIERDDKDRPIRYLACPMGGSPCDLKATIDWNGCFVYREIPDEEVDLDPVS
jgi:hypothetical protein